MFAKQTPIEMIRNQRVFICLAWQGWSMTSTIFYSGLLRQVLIAPDPTGQRIENYFFLKLLFIMPVKTYTFEPYLCNRIRDEALSHHKSGSLVSKAWHRYGGKANKTKRLI